MTEPDKQTRSTRRGFDSLEQEVFLNLWRTYDRLRALEETLFAQFDLTPQQYDSLIKLTAALCKSLPKIRCDYPRDSQGRLIDHVLNNEEYARFQGILGHFHVQQNKQDPGPAFQWERVIAGARSIMRTEN